MRKNHDTEEMGKYLVLRLDFSGVNINDNVHASFRANINNAVQEFSDKYHKAGLLDDPVEVDAGSSMSSLQRLFGDVERSGQQIYLIVDNCGDFANRLVLSVDPSKEDLGHTEYKRLEAGKESMLWTWGSVIKEGSIRAIARAFITGEAPPALSDGISSMVMVGVQTFDWDLTDMFGLTSADVAHGLSMIPTLTEEQRAGYLEQMRLQYGGYRFQSTQKEPLFSPQYVQYFLQHLEQHGAPPTQLIDPALSDPTIAVARFISSNYGARASLALALLSLKQINTTECAVENEFHSRSLFRDITVSSSMTSLAYYYGFLTFQHGDYCHDVVLTSPNTLMQSVFAHALLLVGAPKLQREVFDALVVSSGEPDLQQQLQRIVELETAEVDSQAASQATTEGLRKALKQLPGSNLYSE